MLTVRGRKDVEMAARGSGSGPLLVSTIPLALLDDVLRLAPAISRERAPYVYLLAGEFTRLAADVTLAAFVRLDQSAWHPLLPFACDLLTRSGAHSSSGDARFNLKGGHRVGRRGSERSVVVGCAEGAGETVTPDQGRRRSVMAMIAMLQVSAAKITVASH